MRAYAVELILVGMDGDTPELFKVDPAGHYIGYHGVSSGVKENEAITNLEKEFKNKNGFSNMS